MIEQTLALQEANQRLQAILQHLPQMVWVKDLAGAYVACNPSFEAFLGVPEAELLGKTDFDFFPAEVAQGYRATDQGCHEPLVLEMWLGSARGNHHALVEVTKTALRDAQGQVNGVLCIGRDITQQRQLAAFEKFRSDILELMALRAALTDVLGALAHGLTNLQPQLHCAIMLTDADGRHLHVAVASRLPDFFVEAVDGLTIGMGNGGCATAAHTGEPVIVANIAQHPYWQNYRELASRAGLGACWSQPVFDRDQRVKGVFSVYHSHAHMPSDADITLLEQLAKLVSIALEQQQAASQLEDSEARFRTLAERTPEAILVHRDTTILYVNPAAVRLFGASRPEQLVGTSTVDLVHPDFVEQQLTRLDGIVQGQALLPFVESRFVRLDGVVIDVEVQGTRIVYAGQDAIHVAVRDVSMRKKAEQQQKLAANVFSHAREGILITDAQRNIIDVNVAFTRITGYARAEVLGRNPSLMRSGRHDAAFYADMWHSLTTQDYWEGEFWNRRKSGALYVQQQHISVVRDARGEVAQFVALFTDITQRKEQEQRLQQLAHFDALTGLPNRALKADRLQQAMSQAQRRGQRLALAFIDLDGFKMINDAYGHAAGDHMLVSLAQRMKLVLREGDTLARIGGDEFAAIIVDLDQDNDCEPLLQRLLDAASQPVLFGESLLRVSASIGVTFYPQAQELAGEQLLRQADQAMYLAKLAGKNQYRSFDL